MSEQDYPFGTPSGGTAVADPPSTAVDEVVEGANRRPLIWLVGGAAVLVVALAAYFLLFSGGSSDSAQSLTVVKPPAQPTAAPSAPASAQAIPPTVVGTSGRDPFKPLVVATAPSAAASAAPTTAPTTGSTSTLPTAPGPVTFSVVNVDSTKQTAATTVNGAAYTAKLGEVFATSFKLVAVDAKSPCGVFQYGDLAFSMCKGDTINLA